MSAESPMPRGIIFDLQDTLLVGSPRHHDIIVRSQLADDLTVLRSQGTKLGIATTFEESDARTLMERAGIDSFFNPAHVLGRDSIREMPVMRQVKETRPGLLGKLGVGKIVDRAELEKVQVRPKDSPKGIEFILRQWALSEQEVVLIGDDLLIDGAYAGASGRKSCRFPPWLEKTLA
jgi:phosphoglycolate phosphatase-like HAD superfamily hydrolase